MTSHESRFIRIGRVISATVLLFLVSGLTAISAEPSEQGRIIAPASHEVIDSRQRSAPENRMLTDRLTNLLPQVMAEADIDMWLVLNREYAEDPVYFTLVPQPSFAARRTTMLVFNRLADGTVERLTVNRYPLGEPYESAWSGGDLDAQWAALGDLIRERDPQRIGINTSDTRPTADGLTQGLYSKLLNVLPDGFENRLVSAEDLVVRWLETRSAEEIEVYPHIVSIARGVIAEAFSSQAITPGVSTTDDVAWHIRRRLQSLGVRIWFMPYVNLQRAGEKCDEESVYCGTEGVIRQGDVLHTDVGICYLKLCTDTQEMAYVLRAAEDDIPQGLKDALEQANRWQDLLTAEFQTGRTGNEILLAAQQSMKDEPWTFNIYSHPIGFFGHAPGPTIGMWDLPGAVSGTGDWPLFPNTAYAIEGSIMYPLPEWSNQLVNMKTEQSALFNGERVIYLAGRQTEWHVIR